MSVIDLLIGFNLKFKIKHSIPGRMRVHFPKGQSVPKEWQLNLEDLDIEKIMPGIMALEFSYVSGNALILYNSNQLSETNIINNLKEIAKLALKHKKYLETFSVEQQDEAVAWFKDTLSQELVLEHK